MVVGSESQFGDFQRAGLLQSLLFEGEVGVEVDLGGFDGFVPEPKRDYRTVDTPL